MKKTLLSVMAVMAMGAAAQAQEMEFGVKAGVNLATYGGDIEDRDTRTGAHVGILAEFGLSENFAIQPEIVFFQCREQTGSILLLLMSKTLSCS